VGAGSRGLGLAFFGELAAQMSSVASCEGLSGLVDYLDAEAIFGEGFISRDSGISDADLSRDCAEPGDRVSSGLNRFGGEKKL
jgi:hypothetical protein